MSSHGKISVAVTAWLGLTSLCGAQAQEPLSPSGLLFSPGVLNSQPSTFVPPQSNRAPAGAPDAAATPEKGLSLGQLGTDGGAVGIPSGRGAPVAPSSPAGAFDGRMQLGGVFLGFETETKVRGIPLVDDKEFAYDDLAQRPGFRIPFIGFSITSPIR